MERFQPVFLVDKKFYQVLVYDSEKKDDVLVNFGDEESIAITDNIIKGDEATLVKRDEYLKINPANDDPRTPEYWTDRYIWLSGEEYVYDLPPDGKKLEAPIFPAPLAIDPPFAYPVMIQSSYYPQYPDYYNYYSGYYPYNEYYPSYYPQYYSRTYATPYGGYGGYGGYRGYGATAAVAGLTGLALGGLLGSTLGRGHR